MTSVTADLDTVKPTSLPVVRDAVVADEEAVMALCRSLHEENGLFRFDEDLVRVAVRRALAKDHAILGVIDRDGVLQGCVYLYIDHAWYSRDNVVEELFNFVHQDHRVGTNNAKSLIAWAKTCAERLELPLMIGVISNNRTAAKVRLYKQQLPQVGAFFLHNAEALGRHTADVR